MDVTALQNALATGDWALAESILAPVAAEKNAHPSLLYNYGKVLLELRRINAWLLSPNDLDACRNLGRVAIRCGNYSAAKAGWNALAGDEEDDIANRH
ncbi:hypothetical protein TG4357_02950 [Thalassovita gelatinovora]|uniref:Uncharacterized protein n=1 Tax=Thalassovita gelatinovora TaxID=53501 RepID=A0A0P1FHF6_THAGE|nr:hypothetical protein [Thalassovita gelatinovora]QIZ81946.1 hypothetical protein HFZ77_16380 [Thalassovita gelatinovora]CUH67341.1 hypothetical protein TG4357_02950 [Thalassovita gelatinovora]SEP75969.1 hypothetical protein SAMN04488043_101309 [Thalassovita gelatinovora]